MKMKKIAIILFGNYLNDGRVQRTAEVLSEKYEVKVFVTTDNIDKYPSIHHGINIRMSPLITKKLPNHPLVQILKFFEYFIITLKHINEYNPDIVYCNDVYTLFFGWWFKKSKKKFIYDSHELWKDTMHNYAYNAILFKVLYWVQKKTIRSADAVITVNESIATMMKNDHDIAEPAIIMNIAENPRIENCNTIRKLIGVSAETTIILFVGGITSGRGLENLVISCKYWKENSVLVFLGFGVLIPKLKIIIKENSLCEKVFFLKPVPQSEVSSFVDGCDAGIITYENTCLNHYYALPNKVFQVAGMKKVLLASDFPELRKIISEYNLGYLFNPDDPTEIAKAVNTMIKEDFRISDANYKSFIGDYNWKNEKQKLLQILREVSDD